MYQLVLMLIILHYAIVFEVVLDWLKYRSFPWAIDRLAKALGFLSYCAVTAVITQLLSFNTLDQILTFITGWLIARWVIRGKL